MLFWTSALASTIPIPSGLFIPVLKMGAAYGRLLGELMHLACPNGIKYGGYLHTVTIVPGSYAVVGAAALSGAVTHTISTSVILFEMTGQIVHIIPVILGVLISNAVCQSLQPSIYDSIIEIKKLPYLPPIASNNSFSHKLLVKDFMNSNLIYIWKNKCTYLDLKSLLMQHKKIISFPMVESHESMKLLGSVSRPDLLKLLFLHLGRERRLQEVCRHTQTGKHMMTEENEKAIQYSSTDQQLQVQNRPTKSILKTSSSNNLQKRNLSSPNFYKQFSWTTNETYKRPTNLAQVLTANDDNLRANNKLKFELGDSNDNPVEISNNKTTPPKRKVKLPCLRVVDMTREEQEQWEKDQLNAFIDFSRCTIDEAPFQLVEQTSLYRVHTLFSMLGLNHAYVTSFGRLVGVVALKDIRNTIEKAVQEK